MAKVSRRTRYPDCLCHTGNYCRRHMRYGNVKRRDVETVSEDYDVYTLVHCQRAGGGRRMLGKHLSD